MMLRESFGLTKEAEQIESTVDRLFSDGIRTPDIVEPGMHDRELATEPVLRDGDAHPHRKVLLRFPLKVLSASGHALSSLFVLYC